MAKKEIIEKKDQVQDKVEKTSSKKSSYSKKKKN